LQQTPSAQKPESQSATAAHTEPSGRLPLPHLPPLQVTPSAQSLLVAHEARHLLVAASQL
jgi:hypothetical protein